MTEVRNIGASLRDFIPPTPLPDRDTLVEDLRRISEIRAFDVREGHLGLSVPLGVALAHVDASVLWSAICHLRSYARVVIRAAAVLDGEDFRAWSEGFGMVSDDAGERIDLLPDGAVRFHHAGEPGNDVIGEGEEEPAGAGVLGAYPLDQGRGQGADEVAKHDLVGGHHLPVDHFEPPVSRRATPPP